MVMLVIAAITVMIATTVISAAVTTTAASTCHVLNQVLNLLFGSLAVLNHAALEVQSLACKRVVGVNSNTVFLYLGNLCHKLVVFIIHQCDNSSFKDILVIKMTVNGEYLAAHLVHTLGNILAKSFSRSQLEIEIAAFLQALYLFLESIKCYAESCDKLKWALVACLLPTLIGVLLCLLVRAVFALIGA